MASITIRDLDDGIKSSLRIQAAEHGHSMEEEAREILRAALKPGHEKSTNLAQTIRKRFAPLGGIELPKNMRGPMRKPVKFES